MKSVNRGFLIGSMLSVVGFILLGSGLPALRCQAYLDCSIRRPHAGFPRRHTACRTSRPACPTWATFGVAGLDMRPAWTCLIGIILAVALNKCTEYYTGTEFVPVKSLAKTCEPAMPRISSKASRSAMKAPWRPR